MELNNLKKLRKAIRSSFTRIVSRIKIQLESAEADKHEVQVALTLLENKCAELKDINEKILTLLLNVEDADLKEEMQAVEEYDSNFVDIHTKGMSIINVPLLVNESSDTFSENKNKRKFKLPKLEFRKFGDDIKEWLPFWSQFQKIHDDCDISEDDKFQYLIQATVKGSRAREVVESYPPIKDNYCKAIDSLKSRCGREDLLVEIYVRELLQLIISVHQTRQNISYSSLYDKLESYLRALETLGVTTDKCASMLFPLVESCFNEDFLKAWHRNVTLESKDDSKTRLDSLMKFLKSEVENEESINLAVSGFGLLRNKSSKENIEKKRINLNTYKDKIHTASALTASTHTTDFKRCAFCDGRHLSSNCFSAQKMNLVEKRKILKDKGCCYLCLKPGHQAKLCRSYFKCTNCNKRHLTIMCDEFKSDTYRQQQEMKETAVEEKSKDVTMTTMSKSPRVILPTLKVKLVSTSGHKEIEVNAILDTASQHSYILKDLAAKLNYEKIRDEVVIHSLFGGIETEQRQQNCYRIRLRKLDDTFTCNFEALDQDMICSNLSPVKNGPWLNELKKLHVSLTDVDENPKAIHVLIGADVYGKLVTGKHEVLPCGLVAIETFLGWTLLGKSPEIERNTNTAMLVTSLFIKEADISDLWKLDLIGIKDPIERLSKSEQEAIAKNHFLETVKFTDNRYEISLPWLESCAPLPDNIDLAKRRLNKVTEKLLFSNHYDAYEDIFHQWLEDGMIEDVPETEISSFGNYLPHRPVFKESATTPIRPVFDASARMANQPSLNQCLQFGPNLIENIPDILMRFRMKKIGIVADIKKAFLQIGVCKDDRNYLRFLWWKNKDCKEYRMFRHKRLVFGVKSSPFLLEAVLNFHIQSYAESCPVVASILTKGFYMDNLVTSIDSEEEVKLFVDGANELMLRGGFELRCWENSSYGKEDETADDSNVLGMKWDSSSDVLRVNMTWFDEVNLETISKRALLSTAHKIFDPMGFVTPVTLCPKLLLREAWQQGLNWDEEIAEDLRKKFLTWFDCLKDLNSISFPRWIKFPLTDTHSCSLHTFCDASKDAYATVVFLRVQIEDNVDVYILASKSRLAPTKGATIPRLELLAALIGARLTKHIIDSLGCTSIKVNYWSDSTTVLTWISKEENWSIFVKNRIDEIRKLTSTTCWGYVPSEDNPADLPSRGCNASSFLKGRWWEGPHWMKDPIENWP
ncbi:uncharacterized protein LOC129222571 [Uloborus diversus]|uniref:uncharacterized protein LOC129222571 n=1 Tax=Uloborus diversus TaxID=327109 RepID=UPI00240A93DF|nr:uncharacterized protein LOC129222571 [Uloborus diversus]